MPKRAIDVIRDEFAQRAMRRRNALKGPFRCPKCLETGRLYVQTDTIDKKEIYTPTTGEPRKVTTRWTQYIFSCRDEGCRLRKVVTRKGDKDIIGTYNEFYDNEITPAMREEQIAMIRDTKFKTIELPYCEVKMR